MYYARNLAEGCEMACVIEEAVAYICIQPNTEIIYLRSNISIGPRIDPCGTPLVYFNIFLLDTISYNTLGSICKVVTEPVTCILVLSNSRQLF